MSYMIRLFFLLFLFTSPGLSNATPAFCNGPLEGEALLERVYDRFLNLSSDYLFEHLRWPSRDRAELILDQVKASLAQVPAEQLASLGLDDLEPYFANITDDFRARFPTRFIALRRKIIAAFTRAVRQTDLPREIRLVPHAPADDLIFLAAVKAKNNGGPTLLQDYLQGELTLEHFRDLFLPERMSARCAPFSQPLMFPDGFKELERAAQFENPTSFYGYVDRELVHKSRSERLIAAIEQTRGFVTVSWTAGKPLNQDFLDALLLLCEHKNFVLVVIPTQQNYAQLPEIFLTHPRIHILTHTIENASLRISNDPLNPYVENPIPRLKKSGRYRPGQMVIAGHPHTILEILPTGFNHLAPVMFMTTGTLNVPLGHYSSIGQGVGKVSNKGFWKARAWVFEKDFGRSEFDPDGSKNVWYSRPVSFADDSATEGVAGIHDLFETFRVRKNSENTRTFEIATVDPIAGYLGDYHDPVTDPNVVRALVSDLGIPTGTRMILLSGDILDNGAISHHALNRNMELHARFQEGGASLQQQINGVIQTINAFQQQFPNAIWGHIVGNHDEWLSRVLEKTPDVDNVINGSLIDELKFAVATLKFNLWEYVFRHRSVVLNTILANFPDKKEILSRVLPVYDPSRIQIQDRGSSLFLGPPGRKNDVGRHGDRVSFGVKAASLRSQASGMPEGGGVTGHTHKPGMYDEVMDVGTASLTDLPYGRGFNSSVGQGLALIYPNGTKQLLLFNRRAGGFRPKRVDPGDIDVVRFFGEDRLVTLPNENERVNLAPYINEAWGELDRLKSLIGDRSPSFRPRPETEPTGT